MAALTRHASLPGDDNPIWSAYAKEAKINTALATRTLRCLKLNNAIRQLSRNRRSAETVTPFIQQSEKLWADNVIAKIESLKDIQEAQYALSVSHSDSAHDVHHLTGLSVARPRAKSVARRAMKVTRFSESTGNVLSATPSLSSALERTRGIILPESLHPDLKRRSWLRPKSPDVDQLVKRSQPQMDIEYIGDVTLSDDSSDTSLEDKTVDYTEISDRAATTSTYDEEFEKLTTDFEYDEYGSGEPRFEPLSPQVRPPNWYKYRLPKSETSTEAIRGNKDRRKQASHYIMVDLVNRKKLNESKDQQKAEERMKLKEENLAKIIAKRVADIKDDTKTKMNMKASKILNKGSAAMYSKTTTSTIPAQDTSSKVSIDNMEQYMDIGLRADMKLKVIKDFLRTKKWQPGERDQMTKMNDMVEYWTKVTKRTNEPGGPPDARGWTDENEKSMFKDIVAQIKERRAYRQFDPLKVLQTTYLRLGKETVRALESMCRELGKEPGIHVHADPMNVYDRNIFKDRSNISNVGDLNDLKHVVSDLLSHYTTVTIWNKHDQYLAASDDCAHDHPAEVLARAHRHHRRGTLTPRTTPPTRDTPPNIYRTGIKSPAGSRRNTVIATPTVQSCANLVNKALEAELNLAETGSHTSVVSNISRLSAKAAERMAQRRASVKHGQGLHLLNELESQRKNRRGSAVPNQGGSHVGSTGSHVGPHVGSTGSHVGPHVGSTGSHVSHVPHHAGSTSTHVSHHTGSVGAHVTREGSHGTLVHSPPSPTQSHKKATGILVTSAVPTTPTPTAPPPEIMPVVVPSPLLVVSERSEAEAVV